MGGLVADGTRVLRLELGHGGPGSIALDLASLGGRRRRSAPAHAPRSPPEPRSPAQPGCGPTALRSLSATRLRLEEHLFTSPHWARRTSTQGRPHDTHTGHLRLFTFQSLRLRVGYIVHHHTIDHSITS